MFFERLGTSLEGPQRERLTGLRAMHEHWRLFDRDHWLRIGWQHVAPLNMYELADVRMLLAINDLPEAALEIAEPIVDAHSTRSLERIRRHRELAWRIRDLADDIAINYKANRREETEQWEQQRTGIRVWLYPGTAGGDQLRAALGAFVRNRDEMARRHAETVAHLKAALPAEQFDIIEMSYLRIIAHGKREPGIAGHERIRAALALDDLTGQQRSDLVEQLMKYIEDDDALTREIAEAKLVSRGTPMYGYAFDVRGDAVYDADGQARRSAAALRQNPLREQRTQLDLAVLRNFRHVLNDAQERAIGIADDRDGD